MTIDWKARCEAAEKALRRARACLPLTPGRRRVLMLLGELKAHETVDTGRIAEVLSSRNQTMRVLCELEDMGLVERVRQGGRGPGNGTLWRLGYLVEVPTDLAPDVEERREGAA